MYLAANASARWESIWSLIGLCVVFILIITAAYYTSKFLGKTNLLQSRNKNISLVETFRISQNKWIQIIKIGKKYIAVAVTKDHVEMLLELSEEELAFDFDDDGKPELAVNFKELFSKAAEKLKEKDKKQDKS